MAESVSGMSGRSPASLGLCCGDSATGDNGADLGFEGIFLCGGSREVFGASGNSRSMFHVSPPGGLVLPPDLIFADAPEAVNLGFCLTGGGGGVGGPAGSKAGGVGGPAQGSSSGSCSGDEDAGGKDVGIGMLVGDDKGPTGEATRFSSSSSSSRTMTSLPGIIGGALVGRLGLALGGTGSLGLANG